MQSYYQKYVFTYLLTFKIFFHYSSSSTPNQNKYLKNMCLKDFALYSGLENEKNILKNYSLQK